MNFDLLKAILLVFSFSLALYFCWLFITKKQLDKILKQNLNVKKVTISSGGTIMIWTSENEFFVDILVDRNLSWKELLNPLNLNYKDFNIDIFNKMQKFDKSEPEMVRLYFKIYYYKSNSEQEDAYSYLKKMNKRLPDPFALLTLFVKDKEFFKENSAFCLWIKDSVIYGIILKDSIKEIILEDKEDIRLLLNKKYFTGRKD